MTIIMVISPVFAYQPVKIEKEFSKLTFYIEKDENKYTYNINFDLKNSNPSQKEYIIIFELWHTNTLTSEFSKNQSIVIEQETEKSYNFIIESENDYNTITLYTLNNNIRTKQCSYQLKILNENKIKKGLNYASLALFISLILFIIIFKKSQEQLWFFTIYIILLFSFFLLLTIY